jgi:hypothetical protein
MTPAVVIGFYMHALKTYGWENRKCTQSRSRHMHTESERYDDGIDL